MDDAVVLLAALLGIVGVGMFLLGVVMFVWGVATLGVRFSVGPSGPRAEKDFWDAIKDILKKCLQVAFDPKRPIADRRIALGFILMILGAGVLITALGIVAADALASGGGSGDTTTGTTDTTTTDTTTTTTTTG